MGRGFKLHLWGFTMGFMGCVVELFMVHLVPFVSRPHCKQKVPGAPSRCVFC